jgi:hypothetical protein
MKLFATTCAALCAAFLLCAWQAGDSSAYPAEALESGYAIFSHGMRVGELTSSCSAIPRNNKKVLKFESKMHIHAGFVVYSYDLETKEEAMVGEEGTISYRRTTRENGRTCKIEGRLVKDRFLLTIDQDGARRTMNVNRQEYDQTTMDCPELGLKHEGDEAVFRVLDLETLGVVARKYRWLRSEEVTVNGKRIICRVIDFQDPNKNCRRWIAQGDVGALIARQDGKGKSGAYSLRMTRLN